MKIYTLEASTFSRHPVTYSGAFTDYSNAKLKQEELLKDTEIWYDIVSKTVEDYGYTD